MTLQEAIERYIQSLIAEGRSPRTTQAYARDLRTLTAELGEEVDVATLTPSDLLGWAASERVLLKADGDKRAQVTINRARSAVRGLFGFLVRSWAIPRDPSRVLRVPSTDSAPARILAREEEERLLAVMEASKGEAASRDLLMIRLLLATGIRLGSLVALDSRDVDLANERLSVKAKGRRRLLVKLPRELGEALLAQHDAEGPLFRSRSGRRIGARQVQLRLKRWLKQAGLPESIGVHDLRHTFGTRMYQETRDLRAVQVALGHRSVRSTERYVVYRPLAISKPN
ncbi:MAG: tyrosine-type recombinase/integrase [Polyangiaceae bacterium]|nr:tyrosine-type recombinase/integrase [Polyangiaceae bacterium]